jgi:hypothetical protein
MWYNMDGKERLDYNPCLPFVDNSMLLQSKIEPSDSIYSPLTHPSFPNLPLTFRFLYLWQRVWIPSPDQLPMDDEYWTCGDGECLTWHFSPPSGAAPLKLEQGLWRLISMTSSKQLWDQPSDENLHVSLAWQLQSANHAQGSRQNKPMVHHW